MRIDFLGRFRDLQAVVKTEERALTAKPQSSGFEQLLKSISPDNAASQNIAPQSVFPLAPQAPQEAMASLRPRLSEPLAPSLDRLGVDLGMQPQMPSVDGGVKTPTLLSARRIPATYAETTRVEVREISKLVQDAGKKHGVDPTLGLAVAKAESSFNHMAVSADGHESKGIFQLLDSTGNHLWKNAGLEHPYDPFNPKQNVDLGVGYLRYLHDLFSHESQLPNNLSTVAAANSSSLEKLAVAAFNAGEGRVAAAQHSARQAGKDPSDYQQVAAYLPGSTQEYVDRVFTYRLDLSSADETL